MEKICKQSFNIISLGNNCSLSMYLEENGFRGFSGPFDWLITDSFQKLSELIINNFNSFMSYDNLYQSKKYPSHYYDKSNDIYFYHDFNSKSLKEQYDKVYEKYLRRIKNFYLCINKPTIFIRKIKNINELDSCKEDYKEFNIMIRKYNEMNFLLIVDENNDIIDSHINLREFLYDYVSKEYILKNKEFYAKKMHRNRTYRRKSRLYNKILRFLPHYKHCKRY